MGGWASGSLYTFEVALLLKDFDTATTRAIGFHSFQATMLSWCAKFGIARELRRTFGYHRCGGEKSVATYAWDEPAEPLRAQGQRNGAAPH